MCIKNSTKESLEVVHHSIQSVGLSDGWRSACKYERIYLENGGIRNE